jgi:hypothetical protein
MSRLLGLREEFRSRRRKAVLVTAVTACALIAISVAVARYAVKRNAPIGNTAEVAQTVNLWDAGTARGEQLGQLESVSLPAAFVRLTIVLPRHSAPGQYLVAITRDQNGNGLVAARSATTVGTGNQQEITADLDLRTAKAGQYFLSTTHEQDQAAYYYPLRIR